MWLVLENQDPDQRAARLALNQTGKLGDPRIIARQAGSDGNRLREPFTFGAAETTIEDNQRPLGRRSIISAGPARFNRQRCSFAACALS
jgi:hypothetical protein